MASDVAEVIIFISLIIIGIGLFFYTFHRYRKKKEDETSPFDCVDAITCIDCYDVGGVKKGVDCDCFNL